MSKIDIGLRIALSSRAPMEDAMTMNVSVGDHWEGFVAEVVKAGRYSSASEVVREGLRLVQEREAKLTALREMLNSSIAEGGRRSTSDVMDAVRAALDEWEQQAATN